MANIINPSTPFFKWKMAIVTKSTDDWTKWNCDETYERSLFIGIRDDLEKPYAALYLIYKGTVQPAAGNAILADLLSLQTTVNNAVQELQSLIDQVNATSASMQELWQKVNVLVAEMEDKLEDMQIQIGKAKAWAEGTDAEVTPMGGIHSAKTWAGVAKQAADLATGAAFPILENGDQGKALVVNDTADGYVVSTISSSGALGTANTCEEATDGSFSYYEGVDRYFAVPAGTEGIVINGYDADGAPMVSDATMKTKYSFRAVNTDADKGFWYLTETDDGTVMPTWARPQYTFIGAKPTDGSYGYWLDTANGKFWRIDSTGQLYKASAPIGYMGENGYYMPFDGFSIAQNVNGISYVLRKSSPIQFPWGSGRAGEYAHGTGIAARFIDGTWKLAYALPADITSYAYILLRSLPTEQSEDIIGSNQLGFDAYSNLYKGTTTAIKDRPMMYLGCWGDTSVFPKVVACTGGSLPVINFVRKVQNWQYSTAGDFTPWQTIELVRDGKPTLGQYQRALYGKVFFDIESEKYYRAQYAAVGEGCVPYNTPFTDTTYWKDITPPRTDNANNWTAKQTFQEAQFQGDVTLSSLVDASEATGVFVPDYAYPASDPASQVEAVNRRMLGFALLAKEDTNKGVSLSEPSATSPFAGVIQTVGSVTLDDATGIASGFDASSYLKMETPAKDGYGFDMIFRVYQNSATGRGAIMAWDSSDGNIANTEVGLQDMTPYTFQNSQMLCAVSPALPANQWNWVRFKKSSSSVDVYVLPDANEQYSLASLPDLGAWTHSDSSGFLGLPSAGRTLYIGRSFVDSSYFLHGNIDMFNTRITLGDTLYYDGSTLVQTAYETKGIHQQSACLVNPSVLVRRFESNGKTYMELDGTFSGTVAADNTISINAKAYSFKGTLISLQAMSLGTGTVMVNYNSTTAADLENGTITLRTSISAGEAFSVSLHCVIAQGG